MLRLRQEDGEDGGRRLRGMLKGVGLGGLRWGCREVCVSQTLTDLGNLTLVSATLSGEER